MLWALLSLMSGLGDAISFAVLKKMSSEDNRLVLAYRFIGTLPFIFLLLLFFETPKVGWNFYLVTFLNDIFLLAGYFFLIKALEKKDLSLSVPMLSFTPIFIAVISYFTLREIPSFIGFIGIFLIIAGSFILNSSPRKFGLSALKDRSTLLMLGAAFCFSMTSVFSKIGINLSNPAFYMAAAYIIASLILILLFFRKIFFDLDFLKRNYGKIAAIGLSCAFMEIFIAFAFQMTIIAYAISLKRSSILFSVLIGILLFREKKIKQAVIGGAIMFAGAVLIAFS